MTTLTRLGTAVQLGHWEPNTEPWYAARASRLGGSDIAAVLGLSKWESPFSLWHRKSALIGEQPENPQMEWGARLEPVIATKFSDNHPEFDVVTGGTYVHHERNWQLANPDRFIADRVVCGACDAGLPMSCCCPDSSAILECKTARDDWEWGPAGTDEIPVPYRCQVLWYLDVFGFDTAYVAVLIAGSDYREYVIHAAPDEQAFMRTAGQEFLASIERGKRPDIDSHSATYQAIRQLPDGVIDEAVQLDPDLADRFIRALAAAREADAERNAMASWVLDAIGDYRHADCGTQRIATRAVTKDGRTHSLRPARNLAPTGDHE